MSDLLRVEDLKVSYGAVQALRGVSLTVRAGEIVSLLGANGAGKSSLLKAVMQAVSHAKGAIYFQDQRLDQFRTDELVQKGIALVPEGRGILSTLSVYENLELGAFHRKNWHSDLDHIYSLFPVIKERLHQNAGTLSGGEQQMLAIGRALLSKPKLLLLDEPFAALDEVTRFVLDSDLRTLHKNLEMTVVFVTHSLSEAAFLSDRILLLSKRDKKISSEVIVPFGKQRDQELRTSPQFTELTKHLFQEFLRL
jgi:branched-chain amino acid transport system ATP-binding protein